MYNDNKVINPKNVNMKIKTLSLGSFIYFSNLLIPFDEQGYHTDGLL